MLIEQSYQAVTAVYTILTKFHIKLLQIISGHLVFLTLITLCNCSKDSISPIVYYIKNQSTRMGK